jgi:hypothetical protein
LAHSFGRLAGKVKAIAPSRFPGLLFYSSTNAFAFVISRIRLLMSQREDRIIREEIQDFSPNSAQKSSLIYLSLLEQMPFGTPSGGMTPECSNGESAVWEVPLR